MILPRRNLSGFANPTGFYGANRQNHGRAKKFRFLIKKS